MIGTFCSHEQKLHECTASSDPSGIQGQEETFQKPDELR